MSDNSSTNLRICSHDFKTLLTKFKRYLSLPTDDAYGIACKNRRFKPDSETLEDGTQAHWIGSRKAEKLVLNFHGQSELPLCQTSAATR